MSWVVYALLSAFFAALTAILAKIGIKNVDSNLATAIRTTVILVITWGIVLIQGTQSNLSSISKYSYLFLILSAFATGLSWLFYFKALQIGEASKVAPIDKLSLVLTVLMAVIFLREKITLAVGIGVVLMAIGAVIISLG